MKQTIMTAAILVCCFSLSPAAAADKVVVIPLMDSSTSAPGGIPTVTSAGQVWMDRNLGALRVATKSADPDSYGTLYQWGRLGDGHEYRSSATIATQSSSDVPGHSSFITGFADWRNPANSNLWQGESGINNPCPAGFRLPTAVEWERERASWTSNNAAGALASPLKLPLAGYRSLAIGTLSTAGNIGNYWSSTVNGGDSLELLIHSIYYAGMNSTNRAWGDSVRCIKD